MPCNRVCPCGQPAVWIYSPATSDKGDPYRCDACVPRGTCGCTHTAAYEKLSIEADAKELPVPSFIPWLHYARDHDGRFSVCVDWDRLDAEYEVVPE